MKALFIVAAAAFIAALLVICAFIFVQSVPALKEVGVFEFLFSSKWNPGKGEFGIATMIVGSCYVTAGALVIGVPIGFLTAVFMARYCPRSLYKVLKPMTNILAGIPSIVYGYFGLRVIVPFIRDNFGGYGQSILACSIVLGVMILPTIISVSENSLRAVPKSYYEGALALGATKERAIFCTEVPAAKSGIMTSIILGLGRVIGETMAVVMICGNQTRFPDSILDGVRTMTANVVLEMSYVEMGSIHESALIATAAVLFVFILIITLLIALIRKSSR
ncbi:MAG: phosphate ABC transporter permease subunit PstC [Bacillota bacterium]|nr:MAG: phosphate ABC transporter permease subunit PstC [Bacillota bacterium]